MLPARWFDGLSSKPRPVMVVLQAGAKGPSLLLHPLNEPGAAPQVFTHAQVGWPEAWSDRRPQRRVVVDLRERGSLEVDAVAAWYSAWVAAGARPGVAQRMQTRWPLLLGAVAVSVVALGLFYRYGTPVAAAQLTRWVPLGWETRLSGDLLQRLDDPQQTLLDARALPRFRGEDKAFDPVAGHIPGARCAPFMGNLDADGCFLSPQQLHARFARLHNNANVLCLGARVTGVELAQAIVDAFLETPFEGGRHQRRLDMLNLPA